MPSKTLRLSGKQMERNWQVLDAANRPLGRVASDAARMLLGKHKPNYEPFLPMGDFVVIINAAEIAVTGEKTKRKIYYRHTGYPGGIRDRTLQEQMDRDPRKVVERAVKGMLPRNSRGRELFRHLKVYLGADHPHEAQVRAGTGVRAAKRARQLAEAATDSIQSLVQVQDQIEKQTISDEKRLTRSLSGYRRSELDAEAERLGIDIDPDWKKNDVAEAVRSHYDANPIAASEED